MRSPWLAVVLAVLLGAVPVGSVQGQVPTLPTRVEPKATRGMPVPFGPGERLDYDVKLGALGKRGEGFMAVLPNLDSVRGHLTYHVEMAIKGGIIWTQVNDNYQSWFDVNTLSTLRFIQDVDELTYERYRDYEIYPSERRYVRADVDDSGEIPTSEPLDDVSFFYFVRTLPLEVGKEYTFNRYFKESGNPVVIRVLRKDTVKVPAGTFPTIVVQPLIKTSGLFGQGGEAHLYFSDDESRYLVLMTSKVPLVGSLSLHLRRITPGHVLVPMGGDAGEGAPGSTRPKPTRPEPARPEPAPPGHDLPGSLPP